MSPQLPHGPRAPPRSTLGLGSERALGVSRWLEGFDVLMPNAQEPPNGCRVWKTCDGAAPPSRAGTGAAGRGEAGRRGGARGSPGCAGRVRGRRGALPWWIPSTPPARATPSTRASSRRGSRGTDSGAALDPRLCVRRAEHAGGGGDRRAADAGRSAILPRVIAFVAASPSIDRTHVVGALTPVRSTGRSTSSRSRAARRSTPGAAAHALGADVHAIALLGGHTGRWVAALWRTRV